ncbi:hypothetical protein GEMRC1_011259 [Eukaryota sp. GEM-RC1]
MTDTFIYIDADNIGNRSPTKFLHALKTTFGLHSQIKVFLTCASQIPPPALCKACELHGAEFILVRHKPDLRESADIQMYASIYADLLEYSDLEERKVTVVVASGDSDFYNVAWALKPFVNVVVCGREGAGTLLKNVASYISYEMLVGEEDFEPLSVAKAFISDVLQNLQGDVLLTIPELEECLVDAHFEYSPLLYGPPQCFTTAELLQQLTVRIDHPTSVHNILAQLDSVKLPTVSEDAMRNKFPMFNKTFDQSNSQIPARIVAPAPPCPQAMASKRRPQIQRVSSIYLVPSQENNPYAPKTKL